MKILHQGDIYWTHDIKESERYPQSIIMIFDQVNIIYIYILYQ